MKIKIKKNHLKNIVVILGIVFILSSFCATGALWYLGEYAVTPADEGGILRSFRIKPGQGLNQISTQLEKQNFIRNRHFFRAIALLKKQGKKIQAGEYAISAAFSPGKILTMFVNGQVKLYRLTIPEGLNIRETANLVEKAGFGTKKDFIKLAYDKNFIRSLGIKADTLEGYLFPETYFFPVDTDTKKIIRKMIQRFNLVFTPQWKKTAREKGFSVNEIVTLGSMIEKETAAPEERPVIASVFHNRLKKGMRLESDPTVIYGIPNFNGNITRKDLRTLTPYNTYKVSGLPAGPIASPGKESLKAAIFPAETEYLFFVSKKNGTHKFTKNYTAHKKAVKKYQIMQ